MVIIKFGKKSKHVIVPDGFVLLKPANIPVYKEVKDYRHNVTLMSDKFLNLFTAKFEDISNEDFFTLDDGDVGPKVEDYSFLIRDKRTITNEEFYPDGTILKENEETGEICELHK